jgi:hypothetical protein
MTKNWKTFAVKKKFCMFKIAIAYPQASIKDVQAAGEAFSPQKRTSSTQNMKFLNTIRIWIH